MGRTPTNLTLTWTVMFRLSSTPPSSKPTSSGLPSTSHRRSARTWYATPNRDRLEREIQHFLGTSGKPVAERLTFESRDVGNALHALSRWCSLETESSEGSERAALVALRGAVDYSDLIHHPTFVEIEVAPDRKRRCIRGGILFIEQEGQRVVVEISASRATTRSSTWTS